MSSIPTITEWIEAALTTVAVRPEYRDDLQEEFADWLVKAAAVQVRSGRFAAGYGLICVGW
jgi:hypothetical protein